MDEIVDRGTLVKILLIVLLGIVLVIGAMAINAMLKVQRLEEEQKQGAYVTQIEGALAESILARQELEARLAEVVPTPTSFPSPPVTLEECEALALVEAEFLIQDEVDMLVLTYDHLGAALLLEACVDHFGEPFNNYQKDYLGNAYEQLEIALSWLDPMWWERIVPIVPEQDEVSG